MADFGLDDFRVMGLNLITYINNEYYCAKEMVLLPGQTCGQHRHPPRETGPGKTETFRCRWGLVYLYVPGETKGDIQAVLPENTPPILPCAKRSCYVQANNIRLRAIRRIGFRLDRVVL